MSSESGLIFTAVVFFAVSCIVKVWVGLPFSLVREPVALFVSLTEPGFQ